MNVRSWLPEHQSASSYQHCAIIKYLSCALHAFFHLVFSKEQPCKARTSISIFQVGRQASVVTSPAQLEVMAELGFPASSPAQGSLLTWCSLLVYPAPPLHSGRPGVGLFCHQGVPGTHPDAQREMLSQYLCKNEGLRCSACGSAARSPYIRTAVAPDFHLRGQFDRKGVGRVEDRPGRWSASKSTLT